MAFTEHTTPRRASFLRVKFTRITTILAWLGRGTRRRKHPHIKDINAHLARDIGLDDANLDLLRHQWPSQTTHHPRG